MVDDFTAIKKLKLAFRAPLRRARKASRSLFLDIFSGSGSVSTALARHGYAVLSIDLLLGEQFDALRKAAEKLIVGWIRYGSVLGVFHWQAAHRTYRARCCLQETFDSSRATLSSLL